MALMAEVPEGRVSLKPAALRHLPDDRARRRARPPAGRPGTRTGGPGRRRPARVIDGAYHSPQLTHPDQWRPRSRRTSLGRRSSAPADDGAAPEAPTGSCWPVPRSRIPPLGVGTWAWGDKSMWGMGGYDSHSPSRLSATRGRPALKRGSSSSIRRRSTAAARASGSSDGCWRRTPVPWPRGHRDEVHALPVEGERQARSSRPPRQSLERLGCDPSTCTRSTAPSRFVRTTPWPRRSRSLTPRGW